MRCTAPQLLDDRQNCRENIRLLVEQSTKAKLRSLTTDCPPGPMSARGESGRAAPKEEVRV